jgi:predicted dehydrogenase
LKRAAIVGCGHIAQTHLRAIRRLRAVELVAVCDSDPGRARAFAQSLGVARAYQQLDALLEQAQPDVVHVLTPPSSHKAIVMRALEAGCHVLVEKPITLDVEEAREILEVARRCDREIAVCHSYAFIPAFLKARRLIDAGALGTMTSADIFWRMSSYRSELRADAVRWMTELPGGMFMEVLPHLVYLLQSVMPNLALAEATEGGPLAVGGSSELRAMFTSDAGPVTLGVSLSSSPVRKLLSIRGTAMSLDIDLATNTLIVLRDRSDTTFNRAITNVGYAWQLVRGLAINAAAAAFGQARHGHEGLIAGVYEALENDAEIPADATG